MTDEAAIAEARSIQAEQIKNESLSIFNNVSVHERMLGDKVRISSYQRAIQRHVKPGDVVVDLGTGTGILAFMAAKQGAKVYAIDHSDTISLARHLAGANGLDNIEFIKGNAAELELPEKADVIVQEQIGDCLLDEGMIFSLADARERMLKPGGKILPHHFDMMIEPVELVESARLPFLHKMTVAGIDYSSLANVLPEQDWRYARRFLGRKDVAHFLCEPAPLLSIDLHTIEPDTFPTVFNFARPTVRAGRLDGYCVYFSARFDDEIAFGTHPLGHETHWGMPMYRSASNPVAEGEMIEFEWEFVDPHMEKTWVLRPGPRHQL